MSAITLKARTAAPEDVTLIFPETEWTPRRRLAWAILKANCTEYVDYIKPPKQRFKPKPIWQWERRR